ncbi:zinc finger protein 280C [Notolabrus celidotus]|uniref:zinc finger protein 280C n=1 Tax=Notolabrus celidotus TaxID=1203425 RepID=UPI00148FB860|nr:zinc finger protein 280C [Notolabrus celidotus]
MSELFMECVEEELEPWQKQVPEVQLIEDDDDEPIFVGVLSSNQKDSRSNPPPPQRNSAGKPEIKHTAIQPAISSSPIMLPVNVAGNAVNAAAPNMTTVTPQPVIVNNQGFIVTSPNLVNNREFLASLGNQYPPGTSFTIVSAGQPQLFQQVSPATVIPSAVHRPQVQQISNNIVTLANVRNPAMYSTQPNPMQLSLSNSQAPHTFTVPIQTNNNNRDHNFAKQRLPPQQADNSAKRPKIDFVPTNTAVPVENGVTKKKCPKCDEEFITLDALRSHISSGCVNVQSMAQDIGSNKRIMLVSDFYYGRFEGDGKKKETTLRTNNTFKCQSCLKILKNNIRFMNHMKHHLELEKQNSESWESHTTCQHCYRKYGTPFQLQCHIESAHSPIESSTNCKICELAFESEQVLLEHMKDNHKPGEMPYVCQVCSFRSSFFSDVEAHFRSAHENTKDLLCPFCLKVLKSGHVYMQHYMKHQRKGIHRCGKCRLNFLTLKEKVEHRANVHKTFRKPKALEGLPPGTKVTIRASLTGKSTSLPTSPDRPIPIVGPQKQSLNQKTKTPINILNPRSNISAAGKAKATQSKKQNNRTGKHNLALRGLSLKGKRYTCIECNSSVDDFFTHFPMVSNCGACKYKTSCKVAIGNHMIRFHSTITKNRFSKMDHKKQSSALKSTLVCLHCDLLVDGSAGDQMTKHLTDRPNHVCKVIQDKDMKAKGRVQYVLGQPVKVLYLLTSARAQKVMETDMKLAVSVPPGNVPSGSVPTGSGPPGSFPPESVHPGSVPSGGDPPKSVPPGSFPPESVLNASVPSGSVPPKSVPPERVPPESVPSESVPPESVPPESVPSGSVSPAKSDKPESEPVLPAGHQENGTTEIIVIEGSFEEQTQQPLQPDALSVGAPDGDSALREESVVETDDLVVADQLPVPEQEVGEQQTETE